MNGPSRYGLTSPAGMEQGKFRVLRDASGREVAVNGRGNVFLMRGVAAELAKSGATLSPGASSLVTKHQKGPIPGRRTRPPDPRTRAGERLDARAAAPYPQRRLRRSHRLRLRRRHCGCRRPAHPRRKRRRSPVGHGAADPLSHGRRQPELTGHGRPGTGARRRDVRRLAERGVVQHRLPAHGPAPGGCGIFRRRRQHRDRVQRRRGRLRQRQPEPDRLRRERLAVRGPRPGFRGHRLRRPLRHQRRRADRERHRRHERHLPGRRRHGRQLRTDRAGVRRGFHPRVRPLLGARPLPGQRELRHRQLRGRQFRGPPDDVSVPVERGAADAFDRRHRLDLVVVPAGGRGRFRRDPRA